MTTDAAADHDMDETMMRRALARARAGWAAGEVPVGAVVARGGVVLAQAYNRTLTDRDPAGHAEIVALRRAAATHGHRLTGATLYVTLEPCAMCAGAISHARIERLVFAAPDPKGGAVLHGPRLFEQPTIHHRPRVAQDLFADEASDLLRSFFRARRR